MRAAAMPIFAFAIDYLLRHFAIRAMPPFSACRPITFATFAASAEAAAISMRR